MTTIWQSRKFLTMLVDAVVSIAGIVLAWYLTPDRVTQVMTVVGVIQPVVIAYIASVTAEDSAKLKAGVHPSQTQTPPPQG